MYSLFPSILYIPIFLPSSTFSTSLLYIPYFFSYYIFPISFPIVHSSLPAVLCIPHCLPLLYIPYTPCILSVSQVSSYLYKIIWHGDTESNGQERYFRKFQCLFTSPALEEFRVPRADILRHNMAAADNVSAGVLEDVGYGQGPCACTGRVTAMHREKS